MKPDLLGDGPSTHVTGIDLFGAHAARRMAAQKGYVAASAHADDAGKLLFHLAKPYLQGAPGARRLSFAFLCSLVTVRTLVGLHGPTGPPAASRERPPTPQNLGRRRSCDPLIRGQAA